MDSNSFTYPLLSLGRNGKKIEKLTIKAQRQELSSKVKEKAHSLGFSLVGISPVKEIPQEFYQWWLGQGYAADMDYLHYQKKKRKKLTHIHPKAKSALVCGMPFPDGKEEKEKSQYGRVARYAQGKDYHLVMKEKLDEIARFIDEEIQAKPEEKSLSYVDTGPISERSLGKQAGIGWIGKNSMLIHPKEGSWFWIGEIITTAILEKDEPISDHCGSCRRCIDACPTTAILENLRAIDSRKCIAYLTIEHKKEIPPVYHEKIENWLLGCDICQEVCPWNSPRMQKRRKRPPSTGWLNLREIHAMQAKLFKEKFSKTPLSRPKLAGLKRNAKIVEKNQEKQREKKSLPTST